MEYWSAAVSITCACFLAVLMLLGIMGNILVAIATYQRQIRTLPGTVFIRNLAFIDIGGSASLVFMLVTIVCRGEWVFGHVGCEVSGVLVVFFGTSTLQALWVLSLNRYFKICKPAKYDRVFRSKMRAVFLAIPWVTPTIFAIAPVLGWSSYQYQVSKCVCHFHFRESISYTVTFLVMFVGAPLGLIAFCYFGIYHAVKVHRVNFRNSITFSTHVEDIRSAWIILVVVITFVMCYTPASTVNTLELASVHVRPLADLLSIILVVSKHAQNPLLYGCLNRRYRHVFVRLLRRLVYSEGRENNKIHVTRTHARMSIVLAATDSGPSTGAR